MNEKFEAGYNIYSGVIKAIDIEEKFLDSNESQELIEKLHLDFYQHETKLKASTILEAEANIHARLAVLHQQKAMGAKMMLADIDKTIDQPLVEYRKKVNELILEKMRLSGEIQQDDFYSIIDKSIGKK